MPAPNRTWAKPTQTAPTVEDENDPVLGWAAQYTVGPTQRQAYAPWASGHRFVAASDIVNPSAAPTGAIAATGGTLIAADYTYAYTFATAKSESLASPTVTKTVASGTTNKITLTLPSISGSAWYDRLNIYLSVGGVLQRIGSTVTTTFQDTGLTPNSSLVAATSGTSSASYYEVNH